MQRILLSFLGQVGKKGDFYEPTSYDFGAGASINATYIGHALLEYLRRHRKTIDLVVLLGTRSSMWDALVEKLNPGDGFEEERLALLEAVKAEEVDQAGLDRLRPLMSRALGTECRPVLIEMARSEKQQLDILHQILGTIGAIGCEDELVLDVTHGFRHLPMFGLLAAMYFEVAYDAKVAGIYYGAFDMREPGQPTPVVRLDGLMHMYRWIRALHIYKEYGDLNPCVALLKKDGVVEDDTGGRALWWLAYFERTGQIDRAQAEVERFCAGAGSNWPGVSGLFEERLLARLPQPGQSLYNRQRQLALLHFEHRDFLRAAIFGLEAAITRLTMRWQGNPASYQDREAAVAHFFATADHETREALRTLRILRNALAHAGRAGGDIEPALVDPNGISGFIENRLRWLAPEL